MGKDDLSLTDYAQLYAALHCQLGSANIMTSPTVVSILTQYYVSKGIKVFGQKGVDAVLTELKQLHDGMVIKPKHHKDLSRREKSAVLQYLMFFTQKHCGKIKGRGCADGKKQRIYKIKSYMSSPTVGVVSLMLPCIIDAEEGRDVATVNIPGAFMQADMDET
eukprot:5859525-Ditylum_brightwellii.AAC.1